MTDRDRFLDQYFSLVDSNAPLKVVLSKPRGSYGFRSASIARLKDGETNEYKIVERSHVQHFTYHADKEGIKSYVKEALIQKYFFCEIMSDDGCGVLLQNAKGNSKFIKKKGFELIEKEALHHEKQYLVPPSAPFLQVLGLSTSLGKIHDKAQKKYRQINKYIEILDGLVDKKKSSVSIIDMGSGKAYLTFAAYYYFKEIRNLEVTIEGYEIRQELVDQCNEAASKLSYHGLSFLQGSIEQAEVKGKDILISLHACDIATDMAIYAGLKAKVKVMVLAPCCHKQLRSQISLKDGILKHGIFQERTTEMITDAIRALIMESYGYNTKVFEFISHEHTSKNTMIVGKRFKFNPNAGLEIKDIKEKYGVLIHYLEELIGKIY